MGARLTREESDLRDSVRRVLYANQSLALIDLSVCYLTHMDAAEIAKGLKVNRSLQHLNLLENEVADDMKKLLRQNDERICFTRSDFEKYGRGQEKGQKDACEKSGSDLQDDAENVMEVNEEEAR